jgi:hypothetical protein
MSYRNAYKYIIAGSILFLIGLILLGCNGNKPSQADGKTGTNMKTDAAPVTAESSKGSAQLWAENCGRCHNIRTPTSYSDNEWQVAMHHMRVRGYLTGEEQRRILEFLKASN